MAQLILLNQRMRTLCHQMTCDCGFPMSARSLDAVYALYEEHLRWHETEMPVERRGAVLAAMRDANQELK